MRASRDPRWSNPWTVPGYLALGLMSGALLLHAFSTVFDAFAGLAAPDGFTGWLALLLLFLGLAVKLGYWWSIDHASPSRDHRERDGIERTRAGAAIRAAAHGRQLRHAGDGLPHRAASTPRSCAGSPCCLGFAVPVLLVLGSALVPAAAGAAILALLAAPFMLLGLLVERWLFFAEARHVVTLYYGAAAV